jgi:anti-sigma B factor antagonist
MQYKHLQVRDDGDVVVVQILGTRVAGVMEIEELGQELYQLIDEGRHTKLVLDFSSVGYLSSAMFGKLLRLNGKVKACGGMLRLCGICPTILEVFHVCKLDTIFDIRHDEADALPRF